MRNKSLKEEDRKFPHFPFYKTFQWISNLQFQDCLNPMYNSHLYKVKSNSFIKNFYQYKDEIMILKSSKFVDD